MVAKKKGRLKAAEKPAFDVIQYAGQIWLAGLGAMVIAQKEGPKMFDTLVDAGKKFQRSNRKAVEGAVHELQKEFKASVKGVSKQATDTWDKLEKVFQDRVARALHQLGVPTSREIQSLSRKVDTLNRHVQELDRPRPAAAKKRPTVKKTTATKRVRQEAA